MQSRIEALRQLRKGYQGLAANTARQKVLHAETYHTTADLYEELVVRSDSINLETAGNAEPTDVEAILRTVRLCAEQPTQHTSTPAEDLPVVSGIIPPDIRRNHLVLSLANKATEKNHMLHST